jgi:hypothetical protein
MTRIDKACYERGCACYDDRVDGDAVEVVLAQTQEPWCMKMNDCKTKCEDCPDEPPQRTWVGLTDEEIDGLHMEVKVRLMGTFDTKDIYRAIEAKLKEKNT